MPTLVLSTPLQSRVGVARVRVEAARVAEALAELESAHPELSGWLVDERGTLRDHVNVFKNDRLVDLEAELAADDELYIIQAISGGDAAALGAER